MPEVGAKPLGTGEEDVTAELPEVPTAEPTGQCMQNFNLATKVFFISLKTPQQPSRQNNKKDWLLHETQTTIIIGSICHVCGLVDQLLVMNKIHYSRVYTT